MAVKAHIKDKVIGWTNRPYLDNETVACCGDFFHVTQTNINKLKQEAVIKLPSLKSACILSNVILAKMCSQIWLFCSIWQSTKGSQKEEFEQTVCVCVCAFVFSLSLWLTLRLRILLNRETITNTKSVENFSQGNEQISRAKAKPSPNSWLRRTWSKGLVFYHYHVIPSVLQGRFRSPNQRLRHLKRLVLKTS